MKKTVLQLRLALLTLLLISGFTSLFAQTAMVKGFVYEKETGEPVIFTNAYLYRTTHGCATDVNGYFAITQIPAGNYTLMVTYMGYDTLRQEITLAPNQILTQNLYLEKASYNLQMVNISAEREEAVTETRTSVVKITPKQINSIPSIGGQPDLAQYMQVLPGVVFTGDQGGQLYIRGGSPIQNKVLLDGMVVYNPFHSIGLFSVFDTDIMRNADIYTGGFGAEYGGRVSSVMDITTRDGNKKRMSGKFSANTFGSKITLEGPIKKQREGGAGSASYVFSFKNSYLEKTSESIYDYVNDDGLPFNFTDVYGKVSIAGDNGSKVNFFGFNFDDAVNNYKSLADFNWKSSGGGMNFVVIPGNSPVLMEGIVAYSKYKMTLQETGDNNPRTSGIDGFNVGLNFTYFLGKDEVKYGVELLGFKTDFEFSNQFNRTIGQTENTTELGAFVKYKKTKGKMLIEPSFRFHWYASLSNLSPEPRLALKYNATEHIRFKLATGLYSQNLISANSERDVVNLFYGFLSGSENIPDKFDGEDVTHYLQKSEHIILGTEIDLARGLSLNVEGYFKNFSQLTSLNNNKIFNDTPEFSDQPDELKSDFKIEKGDAKGVDFALKYNTNNLYLWAVYSLGYVNRNDGTREYVPHYDRRHNVNLVASYKAGASQDWEFNARWNFGSAFPFTPSQGFYEKITFGDGFGTDITSVNGDLGILYGEINSKRMSAYHRLDLNVKKTFFLSERSRLEIDAGATNVYNRPNVFYVDRITNEKVDQLPIMPSLGVSLSF